MTKSLSNKLYLKKQLNSLRMKEGTQILSHLNSFNKIMSDLLCLEVNLEEEDKALLLLSSLPGSYDTQFLLGKLGAVSNKQDNTCQTIDIMIKLQ